MSKRTLNRTPAFFAGCALFLFLAFNQPLVPAQQISEAQRLGELRQLRDELKQTESLRNEDVVVILGERTIIEAARLLVGFEILMANGSLLRVTGVEGELKPAAATVKIDVQAKSSVAINLSLTGRLAGGEIKDDTFRLPFQITDVALTNSPATSLFLKTLLGDWLSPAKWNQELPALEIPLELAKTFQLPAGRFNVDGSPPMEISTPAYQPLLRLAMTSLVILDHRLVIGLRMVENQSPNDNRNLVVRSSYTGSNGDDSSAPFAALEEEVGRLSDKLSSQSDLRVRLSRRVISWILTQIATANQKDFNILLKQGRVREEVTSLATNYTDVESGNGSADVSQLSIENIGDGKIQLKLSGQGELDAQLRGREYGIPYRLSPHTTFTIKEKVLPLQLTSDGERAVLRAVPGTSLPIDLRFTVKIAGRDVGINRNLELQTDRWLNRVEVPSLFGNQISVPKRLEVDARGNRSITSQEKTGFKLSKTRLEAHDDAIEMLADVIFYRAG